MVARSHGVEHEGRVFELIGDEELPREVPAANFRRCTFRSCDVGSTAKTPSQRRIIRNVELVDCIAKNNSSLGPVILENVDVKSLGTNGLAIAWGAAYKHVRIHGKCGRFLLNLPVPDERRPAFLEANQAFYKKIDWALDISEGEFAEMEIRGVPADLIRRDPETQVVLRRSKVVSMEKAWRKLALAGMPWQIALHDLLHGRAEDEVLVAPKRSKNFKAWLAGLKRLQRAGVAERD